MFPRRLPTILHLAAAVVAGVVRVRAAVAEPAACPTCTPALAAVLADPDVAPTDRVPVVFQMRAQLDPAAVIGARDTKEDILAVLVPALQALAHDTQNRPLAGCDGRPGLAAELAAVGATNIRSLWLPNAIVADVPKAMVAPCADRADVAAVDHDVAAGAVPGAAGPPPPVDSLAAIRADAAHAVGRGAGTVVGLIGSGADATHPALAPGLVRRDDGTPVWNDLTADTTEPWDDVGEGTHLLGVAVGRPVQLPADGLPVSVGVAPEAGWIACKAATATPTHARVLKSRVLGCLQWMLDPDAPAPSDPRHVPDVVLASVLFDEPGVCDTSFLDAVRVLRAARIVTVVGTGHDTIEGLPAGPDSLPWPANYPEVLSVGAASDESFRMLADGSYRGVAGCRLPGDAVPPNLPDRFGPQTFAPGRHVRSAWPGGGWAVLDGRPEKVAAAHVAGAAAVVRGLAPGIDVEHLVNLLQKTGLGFTPTDRASQPPALLDLYAAVTRDDAEATGWTAPPAGTVTGTPAAVAVTMLNTGITTWTTGTYALASLGAAWGPAAVALPEPVEPGERVTFAWETTAPGQPGTHPFQWRMARGGTPFGQPSDAVDVPVVGTDLAVYQRRNPAFTSLVPGECAATFLELRNVGTSTWGPHAYALLEVDGTSWSPSRRADLLNVTAPGNVGYFAAQICAPTAPGTYDFQWVFAKDGVPLGTYTPNERITVACTNDSALVGFAPPPDEMRAGTTAAVSLTLRNAGTCSWGAGYCLRSPHGAFWGTPGACLDVFEVVAPGATRSFTLLVTAPDARQRAPLGFQLTAPDGVPFGAVAATSVGIPWDFQASAGWVPAVQGANYWFFRFRPMGMEVWRKLPWAGGDWGDAIWPDRAHPFAQPVARFWKSPVAGWVRVTGGAQRRNPQPCGNGVTVRLKVNHNVTLQAFDIRQNDWSWHPFTAAPFWVNVNDTIRFIVDPRGSDHDCDNTSLDPLVQVLAPASVGPIPSPQPVQDLWDEP